MKHPNKEQWMDFLYGEADAAAAETCRAHLANCAECQRDVEGWRGAMRALDTWRLPEAKPALAASPVWRWAAVASVFLAAGVALGTSTRKAPDVAAIEESISRIAEESAATRQLLNELGARVSADQAATLASLRDIQERSVSDLVALRADLERVALATDASLKLTQRQLVQLASYAPNGDQ